VNIAISQPAVGIDQQVYRVHDQQKTPLLNMLLKNGSYASILIFASRKEIVKSLARELKGLRMKVSAFHSDLEQREREEILLAFKNKLLPVIVGTDALSRGIDVEGIDLVINYDVPGDPEDYIHRIGRTARAETTGTAITFVNHRDERKLKNIEQLIDKPIRLMQVPDELAGIQMVKHEHATNKRPQRRQWGNKSRSGGNRSKS
jgi:ATP-dependent RNA helicase RhlE